MSELKLLYSNEQIKAITDELKKGYPVIMPVQKYSKTNQYPFYFQKAQY